MARNDGNSGGGSNGNSKPQTPKGGGRPGTTPARP